MQLVSTLPELPACHVESIMVLLLAMDAEALEGCLEERTPSLALQVSMGWSKQILCVYYLRVYIYI